MMKRLLFLVAMLACTTITFAQFDNIGLLGGSTVTGWDSDTDMVTTDGIIYTLNDVVITYPENPEEVTPGVKFRKDDAWAINWGGSGFPSGTASLEGPNIPAVNGTYNVTFNKDTGVYSFTAPGFSEVALVIDAMDVEMFTTDGVTYTANNVALEAGNVAFSVDGTTSWGSSGFPTGTAVEGQQIPVLANSYNISFNLDTKAYSFDFVVISMIGDGVVDWTTDIEMATTDGENYTYTLTSAGGEGKFRLNYDWNPGWGSTDFPSGIGSTAGGAPNIPIAAGTYDVTFNRVTGAYNFDEVTASVADFSNSSIKVYPNPSNTVWNFDAGSVIINNVEVIDVTGKVVYANTFAASQVTVNADALAAGIYFTRIYSGASVQTIKVVKK
ncbi:T9SS type A sorting domain-containing protein [Flavobacterium salilacus subsp. salilacus]|uniref:T9SS type A sorting domain-containing protein n=1 Tax=Flavobacterium TaxID=237 RepID=UPI0010755518|nr:MULTISPECIES: T9SS type A sorting domain-containing protein [Flavobacterium]KAF2514821.1 T9SS type A sorting domain-containing protein [Flavobacterium salilacus subsp. salilacus]MBE1615456.1 T9SS type A sorting domain-containing protein [Flavobacterium sp. SaA2.13]